MARGRGGQRQPAKPAAVSGPGALSARTDGGAGNARQPLRAPGGQAYGERKATLDSQRAAPLPDVTGEGPVGIPAAPPGGDADFMQGDAFAPTDNPLEDPFTGSSMETDAVPEDPDMLLRLIYQRFPFAEVGRLIRDA